jgi:SSS family solute:Na+ symporter
VHIPLTWADWLIISIYFGAVLSLGFYLRSRTRTGEDFFLAGRSCSAWVAGLSFIAANLGALELLGWAASAYEYGMLAAHAYWIAAIPAILFLALFMMPFYYVSRTHSVPGYLQLRYGERTRGLSAVVFVVMTLLVAGINMYSMGLVLATILGWDINFSIWFSSLTVGLYVALGGLLSAIFNEILQFFLIWFGSLVIPIVGLIAVGGWSNLVARLPNSYMHLWSTTAHYADNPMGIHWIGIVLGFGFVISFGYWTTDFLVVQRLFAARDLRSAQMAPIIGSFFKMALPLIVILPGLIGLVVLPKLGPGTEHSYNAVVPLLMQRYLGPGLLGLGITALIAGFMSGMAGNISAFATVWTYDIYRAYLKKQASDAHYVRIGRICTVLGVFASIFTAYITMGFPSIMDYMQALFSFFSAPIFGAVLLGMFWRRATPSGGFWGLLTGIVVSISLYFLVASQVLPISWIAFSKNASIMGANMWRAWWGWAATVVVIVLVSLRTAPLSDEALKGLVYGVTPIPRQGTVRWWQRPVVWALLSFACFLALNLYFW